MERDWYMRRPRVLGLTATTWVLGCQRKWENCFEQCVVPFPFALKFSLVMFLQFLVGATGISERELSNHCETLVVKTR